MAGTEIDLKAAHGQRQVLPAVGDAQPTAIDEAGEGTAIGHEVGIAGVAMRDDEILDNGQAGGEARQPLVRVHRGVKVLDIDEIGIQTHPGFGKAERRPVVERTVAPVEMVQSAEHRGADPDGVIDRQVG